MLTTKIIEDRGTWILKVSDGRRSTHKTLAEAEAAETEILKALPKDDLISMLKKGRK